MARSLRGRPPRTPEAGKPCGPVPQFMQMESLECGAACLAMVCAYWGKWMPLEQVRADCGVSRDGSNALNIMKAARRYGFDARGLRYEPGALESKGVFPCIVHWNFNHFVVVRGFRGNHVLINDPARGELKISREEFDGSFTGVCLQLVPGEAFEEGGERPSIWSFVRGRLGGMVPLLVLLAAITALARLLDAVNPLFMQVLVDRLTGSDAGWIAPFVIALAAATLAQMAALACEARYRVKSMGKIAVASSASLFWRILHLPMDFFSQRSPADLAARMDSNATIAAQLVGVFAPLLVNFALLVLYLVMMIGYAPPLAAVGVTAIALNLGVAVFVSRRRVNIMRVRQRAEANFGSSTVAGIDMIETIKASGAEDGYFQRWSGFQASAVNQGAMGVALDAGFGSVPMAITSMANGLILILGCLFIIDGQLTAGMILAFQGYMSRFSAPAEALIAGLQTLFEMRTNMERIQDVMAYEKDALAEMESSTPSGESAADGGGYEKLAGEVRLDSVTFGYSRLADPIIKDFSLHVKPGESVAVVGPSGCGKSTIAKLVSGLYLPWEGDVLLDSRPLLDIPQPVRAGSLAVVEQDAVLFGDTIDANIRLWDDSIENYEMILAARDAELHEDVMARPNGYQAVIAEGGADLSGGQRQRVEIARALAQDPTVLILDEATSALDAVTEKRVMERIRRRGITLIVVAHRLSAVRDCDQIVVMDAGRIVERGTHDELWQAGGLYARLVTVE